MPKVTEAHLKARRQQILDAASACFARQGFHQTTMQDICREAELSPGAVYRYFASKVDIIAAVCENFQQQNLAVIGAATGQSNDTLEVLDQLADSSFSMLGEPEMLETMYLIIQLWAESLRSPQIMEMSRQAGPDLWRAALAHLMRRARERGEIDPSLDPESIARVLVSAWQGLVLQKAFDPQVDVSRYMAVLKALYHGIFRLDGGSDR